jgi:adenosylhomocysteine nucleosidase
VVGALALVAIQSYGIAQERAGLIGLIGIPSEIATVEARIQSPVETRIQGLIFTSGTIDGIRVVVARSGVGKVNAAISATLLLDHFGPSAVLFAGTAGAVDKSLNPTDVVIATAVGYHDFGSLTNRGMSRAATANPASGQYDPLFFPADPDLLAAARRAAKLGLPARGSQNGKDPARIKEGLILTGDTFVSDAGYINDLRRDLKASAVEAEGAAVAQACARYHVPFLLIRAITDRADSQARGSYRQFLEPASRNAADLTLSTIREFVKTSR